MHKILRIILFYFLSRLISAQEIIWIPSDSLLYAYQKNNKYVRIYAYSDKTSYVYRDSVQIPVALQSDKNFRFSHGRLGHGENFIVVKSDKTKSYYILEHDINKNIFNWHSNIQESLINEWFGASAMQYFRDEFQYRGYWILDSGNKRFFLNKLKYSPTNAHFIRYENEWQYDFQHRKVKELWAYGMAENNFILNVYVEEGAKKGWWTLALNDANGKVKYYRRLTRDNDSLTHRLEYFKYDTVFKQFLVITGKNYSLKDFGKNKKEIQFSILDTNLDVLRTWTLFVNTNTKVMKDLKIEYVQPMHYAALAINEFEYSISAWGWGKKNGFYFPVAYYERTLSAEKPIVKTSVNTFPTDILLKDLLLQKINIDSLPLLTEIKDFIFHYPVYSDTSMFITALADVESKYVYVLKPIPSSMISITTFLVEEKIKLLKNESLAMFKSRYFVWMVNQKTGRVIVARKRK